MEYRERERKLRRITSGVYRTRLGFNGRELDLVFRDPSVEVLSLADTVYEQAVDVGRQDGLPTLEESYVTLEREGLWTPQDEKEIQTIQADIKKLSDSLPQLKFHKAQQRSIKKTIDQGYRRLEKLIGKKHQLLPHTLEHMAEKSRRRFVISKIMELPADAPEGLLHNPNFLEAVSVCYFEGGRYPEKELRELARTNPWRLVWTLAKDTGTPLFSRPASEITELQFALVSWSKIYDSAFESQNRPSDDVFDDDELFDAWFRGRHTRAANGPDIPTAMPIADGMMGGTEVFIPADQEGAREVFAMNDADAKRRIALREKELLRRGEGAEVPEQGLPDITRDLQMSYNQMATARGTK